MLHSENSSVAESRVRPIERHDLPAVSGLMARLARHHGDAAAIDLAGLEADLITPAPWVHGLVVERFAFVVGYALMIPRYRAQRTQRGLELHHLYVLEGSRGLGLGRALVAGVLDFARERRCAYLQVGAAAGNERARDFYRSLGFEPADGRGARFSLRLG